MGWPEPVHKNKRKNYQDNCFRDIGYGFGDLSMGINNNRCSICPQQGHANSKICE